MSAVATTETTAPVRIALLGAGTVGSAVVRLLTERRDRCTAALGRPLELVGVAVRDTSRSRDGVPDELLTTDAEALVDAADVVVEVMGGLEPARGLIERALRAGAQVVTANKQLIARHGMELDAVARAATVELGRPVAVDLEAAVVAAVPVISVVSEALAGDEITAVRGVVNGSTNYVLDLAAREGVPFADAVRQAGELGYLEADPTEDLEGIDAAAKIVILARLAFGARPDVDPARITLEGVDRTGIAGVTDADIAAATERGEVVKLVASARPDASAPGGVAVRVAPEPLPAQDPLAGVRGGTNAVEIEAVSAGPLLLRGAGAGGDETASAVLADLLRAARRHGRA